MLTRTTGEWLALFGHTSVPTNMVNTLAGLKDDPHLNAVGFWQEVEHPTEGRLRMTRFPVTFSKTPADVRRLQPRLGRAHGGGAEGSGAGRRRDCQPAEFESAL